MKPVNEHQDHLDPDLRRLSDRLDALGAADASDAPAGLEDRVLAGVGRVLAPEPIRIDAARPALWCRPGVRLAAGLGLAAGVSVLVYQQAVRPSAGVPDTVAVVPVEQRIDGLLALAGDGDDAFGDTVASIELWVDALSAETSDTWLGSDLGFEVGDGWGESIGGGAL